MRGFTLTVLAVVTSVGLSTASLAGIHDVARPFNGIVAREGEGKDTMTVTVTSFPSTCSATTVKPATSLEASESASTPVVIVPGTQSMTATYNVPVGGATVTPGASTMSPMQPLASSSGATTTPGASTMSSMQPTGAAAPSGAAVPISTSANTTSGAQAPAPMGSYGTLSSTLVPNPTTEAAQSSTMAESKSTSTTETTTSETSTTSPSTSSTVVPMSSNDATKSFNGMTAFMVALAGGVALLI